MVVVVSDTSPIRALNHLQLLPVLKPLFTSILIAPAVERELLLPSPAFKSVDVSEYDFIEVRAPRDRARVQVLQSTLDLGESEALALAIEVRAQIVLMDEKAGRKHVARHGMIALGTLGVLLRAKKRGHVESLRPLIERLSGELKFFLTADLKNKVLRLAGESP